MKSFFLINTLANEPDELCASMYSFHSSPEEKNKILYALTQHGIETTVDRVAKKKRIRDWIQESVIQEDDEEEEDEEDEEEIRTTSRAPVRAPVAGHVYIYIVCASSRKRGSHTDCINRKRCLQ